MCQWVDLSDRLREVRAAQEHFALRGVIEQWIIGPMLLDRLADDLTNPQSLGPKLQPSPRKDDGGGRSSQ